MTGSTTCVIDTIPKRQKLKKQQQRWRTIDALIFISVVYASLSPIWLLNKYSYNSNNDGSYTILEGNNQNIISSMKEGNDEYILWSRNETYFHECRKSFLRNNEWGKERAPYVDKVGVKDLIRTWEEEVEDGGQLKSFGLKIPPTLAVFTRANASLFTLGMLKQIPQPYIIKTSHGSGKYAFILCTCAIRML